MLDSINKNGCIAIAAATLYSAFEEKDDDFLQSEFCSDLEYLISEYAGFSIELIRNAYIRNSKLDVSTVREKARTMTCKELAEEFNKTQDAIYAFCRRHHISFKKGGK